jgi:hypothetical protein
LSVAVVNLPQSNSDLCLFPCGNSFGRNSSRNFLIGKKRSNSRRKSSIIHALVCSIRRLFPVTSFQHVTTEEPNIPRHSQCQNVTVSETRD